jgi:hypothetical protein
VSRFQGIIITAVYRLARLDIATVPNLTHSEVIAIKRSQVMHLSLIASVVAAEPIDEIDWIVQLRLRMAVLMHELQAYESANELLEQAISIHIAEAEMYSGSDNEMTIDQELSTAVNASKVRLSVLARSYTRRGFKPSDFPLLLTTWAKYRGRDKELDPKIPGTDRLMRRADGSCCLYLYGRDEA